MATSDAHPHDNSGGQLEIIDITTAADGDLLRARLIWRGWKTAGTSEVAIAEPVSRDEDVLLAWYASSFRSWRSAERDKALTAERTLLNIGRKLGNALVDSQYQFLAFCEQVEAHAARGLQVRIVARDARFQALPWELLILPDSNYVLAATCAGFVRALSHAALSGDGAPESNAARHLQLGSTRALGYVRALSRPQGSSIGARPQCVSLAWEQLGWQGALRYQLLAPVTPDTWQAQSERDQPAHVLHWDGPLTEVDGAACFVSEGPNGEPLPIAAGAFAEQLLRLGVELLIIEPAAQQRALAAEVARCALAAGVGDVLVVHEASSGVWPSVWLDKLLDWLRNGLSVQQAVVETRKSLQRVLVEVRNAAGSAPYAAHSCANLQHYTSRVAESFCFEQPLAVQPYETLESYHALRQSLLGFSAVPTGEELLDDALLSIDRALRGGQPVLLHGRRGTGKTSCLQRVGLFERARGEIRQAYSWDFRTEAYSLEDVLQMVANARGLSEPEHADEQRILGSCKPGADRELFVFDNIDASLGKPGGRETAQALIVLASELCRAGAWCVVSATRVQPVSELFAVADVVHQSIALEAAGESRQVALLHAVSPDVLALGPALWQLVDELDGNPFLLRKVAARATRDNVATLLREALACYGKRHTSEPDAPIGAFIRLRWQELAPHLQRFLALCSQLGGLYLEIPMLGLDRGQAAPTGEFARSLGAPEGETGAALLTALTESGLVAAVGGGRCVDPHAAYLLRDELSRAIEPEDGLSVQFSSVVCQGLVLVIERSQRMHETFIASNLLANRHTLLTRIERVLDAGEYALGTLSLVRLHDLAMKANPRLGAEFAAWALSVLERDATRLSEQRDAAAATAWLNLALHAGTAEQATNSPALRSGVEAWMKVLSDPASVEALPRQVFGLVVRFLQQAHDKAGDYAAHRRVTLLSCQRLQAQADYPSLVVQLQALAVAEHALGNVSECIRIETQLLRDIPYAELRDGAQLRERTLANLAGVRLRRRDEAGCRELLALLDGEPGDGQGRSLANLLRAELALMGEHWREASIAFCELWRTGMSGARGVNVTHAGRRLQHLRRELGADAFDTIYAEHAGSTPTPQAMDIL